MKNSKRNAFEKHKINNKKYGKEYPFSLFLADAFTYGGEFWIW